jgi:group I intron endonuclease
MTIKGKKGIIYKITSPNNKIYIGQTIDFTQRCRKYKSNGFKGQIKLWNNCQKHNWNPIDSIEIIEHCLVTNLDEREKFWIQHFDSFENGLNSDLGGKGRRGFKHSDETKEKIRLANIGKKHTEKTKKKISEASKNISDETRRKMSEASKNRKHSLETKRKISEINKGAKLTDDAKRKISEANKGNKKRLNKKHNDVTKEKISLSKKGVPNVKLSVKIICINTGEIFESQKEASDKLNLNQSSISRVCLKQRKTYKGLIFMFYDEYEKTIKNE